MRNSEPELTFILFFKISSMRSLQHLEKLHLIDKILILKQKNNSLFDSLL